MVDDNWSAWDLTNPNTINDARKPASEKAKMSEQESYQSAWNLDNNEAAANFPGIGMDTKADDIDAIQKSSKGQPVAAFTPSNNSNGDKQNGATGNNYMTADEIMTATNFTPVPNALDGVEQLAYHWSFYITPDIAKTTNEGQQGPGIVYYSQDEIDSKVILAESGLTGFNIQSVIVDDIVAPNFATRNQDQSRFIITIVEPVGANLPDKMFLASQKLNIKNFMKTPYYLSLKFHGYNPEDGSIVDSVGGKTWTWRIMITDLDTNLTTTGTKHVLKAIRYDDLASQNQFGVVPISMNLNVSKGQSTVGEIAESFSNTMNENIKKRYNNNQPYTIKIEDRPYESSMKAKVDSPFKHKIVSDTPWLNSSRNQGTAQISKGTDIYSVFEQLLSAADTAVELANPSSNGGTTPEDLNGEVKPFSVIHKIETQVKITNFDPLTRDYVREFTFIIKPYEVQRVMVSAPQEKSSEENGKKKLEHALNKSYLRKEYNYTYTGKNTDILDFDINLSFMFNVAANFYQGNIFYEMSSPGIQLDEKTFPRTKDTQAWPKDNGNDDIKTLLQDMSNRNFSGGKYIAEDIKVQPNPTLPMTFTQDGIDPRYQVQMTAEGNNLRTRSLYGMILNQLYGARDGNLQDVNLTIRGDPYWLGITNMGDGNEKSSDNAPQFTNGEHMFILKFFMPTGIDDNTGDPIISMSDMYSGFYAVTNVTNNFENGRFTQNLKATRIPGMEVSRVLGVK